MDLFKRTSSMFDSFEDDDESDQGEHTPTGNQGEWSLHTHMKIGFIGEWKIAQILIQGNMLTIQVNEQDEPFEETINAKKIKNSEVIKDATKLCNLNPPEPSSPIIVIEYVDKCLYFMPVCGLTDCTGVEIWIEAARVSNKNGLEDQQLTIDDIPVIVDKCIQFITTQGCLSEGIYRLAGINRRIISLIEEFRRNAWAVRLNPCEYSEHDVANVLKRFFRTLDSPLLTKNLRHSWIEAAGIEDNDHKQEVYRELLSKLPEINYKTLRRLIVHLRSVSEQHEENLMPISNLTSLWGPTTLTVDNMTRFTFSDTPAQVTVLTDLTDHFYDLFDVCDEEVQKEKDLLEVCKSEAAKENPDMHPDLSPTTTPTRQPPGDMKVSMR